MKAPKGAGPRVQPSRLQGPGAAGKTAGAQPPLSATSRGSAAGARGKSATAALRARPARCGALGGAGP